MAICFQASHLSSKAICFQASHLSSKEASKGGIPFPTGQVRQGRADVQPPFKQGKADLWPPFIKRGGFQGKHSGARAGSECTSFVRYS